MEQACQDRALTAYQHWHNIGKMSLPNPCLYLCLFFTFACVSVCLFVDTQPKKIRKPPGLPSSVRAHFCSPSQPTDSFFFFLLSFSLSQHTHAHTHSHTLHSLLCLSSSVTDRGEDPLLSQTLSELTVRRLTELPINNITPDPDHRLKLNVV